MSVVLLLLPMNTGATVGSMPKQHLEASLVSSRSAFFSVLSALVTQHRCLGDICGMNE